MKTDIYQKVTVKIIADLEQGELSWLKPWNSGNLEGKITKPLRHNGIPYNGINILMLWGARVEAGYLSPYWMTFRQAKELGAHVKKGERGNLVVYANTITKTEEQDDGSEEERKIPFMNEIFRSSSCPFSPSSVLVMVLVLAYTTRFPRSPFFTCAPSSLAWRNVIQYEERYPASTLAPHSIKMLIPL